MLVGLYLCGVGKVASGNVFTCRQNNAILRVCVSGLTVFCLWQANEKKQFWCTNWWPMPSSGCLPEEIENKVQPGVGTNGVGGMLGLMWPLSGFSLCGVSLV